LAQSRRMWKALRGRRRAVRGRRSWRGGTFGLLPLERDPTLVLLWRFLPIRSRRTEKCLEVPSLPRCSQVPSLAGSGSQGAKMDDGWGGTEQLHSNRKKNNCGVVGPVILPRLVSCHWPKDHNPAPHVTERLSLHPNFPISIARRGRFSVSFSFFFLCAATTYYTNTPVLLGSWLLGTIMDNVASVVAQSKHIAKLASLTSQSTEKYPPRARWWY